MASRSRRRSSRVLSRRERIIRARQAQIRRQEAEARERAAERARLRRNRLARLRRQEERRELDRLEAARRRRLGSRTRPKSKQQIAREQAARQKLARATSRLRQQQEAKRQADAEVRKAAQQAARKLEEQRRRRLEEIVPPTGRRSRLPRGWQYATDRVRRDLTGFPGIKPEDWTKPIGYAPDRDRLPIFNEDLELFDSPSPFTRKPPSPRQLGYEGKKIGAQIASRVWVYVLVKLPGYMAPMVHQGTVSSPSKARLDAVERLRKQGSRGPVYAIKAMPYTFGNTRRTMEEIHEKLHERSADGEVMWKAMARAWAKEDKYEGMEPVKFLGWAKGEGLVSIESHDQESE